MRDFRTTILILVVLMSLLMYTSCGKQDNFNNVDILRTKDVVNLLKENGVSLTKVYDFPIDLTLCKIHDKKPQPYLSSQTGVYYMFYEYDGYSETSDLIEQIPFYDYPDSDKEFSRFIIPCSGSIGKNLYICLWYSEFGSWEDDMSNIEKDNYDSIVKETSNLRKVLIEKVYDKRTVTLTGKSDNWEIKIPIEYVYNQRKNEKGIIETVFYSRGQTFVKYLNLENKLPNVTSINYSMDNCKASTKIDGEGSILKEQNEEGFYRTHFLLSSFNPEIESSFIVNIICSNGETEEIICTIENNT